MTVLAGTLGPPSAAPRVDVTGFMTAASGVRRGAAACAEGTARLRRVGEALGTAGWSGEAARGAVGRATVLGSRAAQLSAAVEELAAALSAVVPDLEVAARGLGPAAEEAGRSAELRLARAVAAFLADAVLPADLVARPGRLTVGGTPRRGAPPLPVSTAPDVVAAWWEALPPGDRLHLLQSCPHRLGGLDGLPVVVRDRANRSVLAARQRELRAAIGIAAARPRPVGIADYAWRQGGPTATAAGLAELRQQERVLEAVSLAIAPPGRFLLDLDPRAPGRAVVSVGDPDTARHVAVLVPGMGTTVAGDLRRHTAAAARLHAAAGARAPAPDPRPGAAPRGGGSGTPALRPGGEAAAAPAAGGGARTPAVVTRGPAPSGVAVVAWLGYRAPDVTTVLSTDRAHAAVPDLRATMAGLDARALHLHGRPQHATLVGHSYGSLVSGLSLRQPVAVDDLVVLGSPGVAADDRAELHLRGDGGVYVVEAADDPVADSGWFGVDPSRRSFGADQLPGVAGDPPLLAPRGHSRYLDAGTTSLAGVAAVVAGRGPR